MVARKEVSVFEPRVFDGDEFMSQKALSMPLKATVLFDFSKTAANSTQMLQMSDAHKQWQQEYNTSTRTVAIKTTVYILLSSPDLQSKRVSVPDDAYHLLQIPLLSCLCEHLI
jgi:hypothetical protein